MLERKKSRKLFIWTPVIAAFLIILIAAIYAVASVPQPRMDMELGATFSLNYVQDLGLDYKEVYDAVINDLKVRRLRIPIYWNQIEPTPGRFDFTEFDYMIEQAEKAGVEVVAVVGRRQPRWPECHVPGWSGGNAESTQQKNILIAIEETVNRYKGSPAIKMWQVDNEPLFRIFGVCPEPDKEFLREEIGLVRRLDSTRSVQITDSGELSTWIETSYLADQLGISMYRTTWNRYFGYWYYPLSPRFYTRHAKVVAPLVDRIVISELQAEPWFPDRPVILVSLEEQYKSMNPELLRQNVDFARRTGFDEAYLWGVEWWYWLKEMKNDDSMWQAGKELFND